KTSQTAFNETTPLNSGGNIVTVNQVLQTKSGYTQPNQYIVSLGRIFNNIYSINLVESSIPFTSYVINESNNTIEWLDLGESQFLTHHMITIPPGNYDVDQLKIVMETLFLSVDVDRELFRGTDVDYYVNEPITNPSEISLILY